MSVRYPHLSKSWRIAPVRDPRRDRHGLKLGSDFWKCCRNDSPVRTFSFKLEVRLWIRWHRSYSSSTERNKDSCNPKKTRTLAKVCFFLDLLTLFLWVLFSESLSTPFLHHSRLFCCRGSRTITAGHVVYACTRAREKKKDISGDKWNQKPRYMGSFECLSITFLVTQTPPWLNPDDARSCFPGDRAYKGDTGPPLDGVMSIERNEYSSRAHCNLLWHGCGITSFDQTGIESVVLKK